VCIHQLSGLPKTTYGHLVEPKDSCALLHEASSGQQVQIWHASHISSSSSSSRSSGGKSPPVTLLGLTNAPREGGHVKYLFPRTLASRQSRTEICRDETHEPSFFPYGRSYSTPTHTPVLFPNSVGPTYRMVPRLFAPPPPSAEATSQRAPTTISRAATTAAESSAAECSGTAASGAKRPT
jgi:hypothetical protein